MATDYIPITINEKTHEAGTYKGKSFKDGATLDLLAQKVVDQLRSQELPIWQAKDVLKEALQLLDWEILK